MLCEIVRDQIVGRSVIRQLVHPEKTVVAMLGDGCMLMTLGEVALADEFDPSGKDRNDYLQRNVFSPSS